MMLKKKSNPWARLKYLYTLPLAAIAVAAFARPEISQELDEISAVKVNDLTAIMKTSEVKSIENKPAEEIKVQGQVLEEGNRMPVMGANVIIKGTTSGTISDENGNFTIIIPVGATLQISYIGMKTKELIISEELIGKAKSLKVYLQNEEPVKVEPSKANLSKAENETRVKEVPRETVSSVSPVFQVVEEMPEFPGGMGECLAFLGKNVKYPVEAQLAGVQGKVIVQFVVEKNGSIINPKIVRSIDPTLDGEAIRVISIMPKWKPGMQKGKPVSVQYTVPVTFRLDGKTNANDTTHVRVDKNSASLGNSLHFYKGSFALKDIEDKPLVVIDGVKTSFDQMEKMDVTNIASVSVLKDSEAVKLYESEGKNGVILITTKREL